MKISKKGLVLFFGAFIVASLGTIAANASVATTTPPHKATQAEIEENEKSVQTIGTKFGEFERSDKEVSVPADQVVTDSIYANEHTVKIVTKYGTFIKK